MLPAIESQTQARYACGLGVACLNSVLGEKEQAFRWLAKAYLDRTH
jgi:hypothetical protein